MARQAREEGLSDVTDFMSTFEAHQRIADEVKCGVCVYLVVDMFNSGASYAASQGSQLPAYGPGSLSATVASTIAGLCDMETAAEDAPKRFLGLYDLRNGSSGGGGGGGWHVVREEPGSVQEAQRRLSEPGREWQADVHTVLCSRYWSPLAEDMVDAVVEGVGQHSGVGSEEADTATAAAAATLAQGWCDENSLCGADGASKSGKKKKRLKKPRKTRSKKRAKQDLQVKAGELGGVGMAGAIDAIKRARAGGGDPAMARQQMWEQEFDEKMRRARERSAKLRQRKQQASAGGEHAGEL